MSEAPRRRRKRRQSLLLAEDARIEPVISASRGTIEITSARPQHEIKGWRAMFDLRLTDDSVEPINLRLVYVKKS